jgi:hypothetical protein
MESRNALLNSVKTAAKDAKSQKAAILNQMKLNAQKSQADSLELQKQLQTVRASQQSQLDSVSQQIDEMKKRSAKFSLSDTKSRDAAFNSVTESYMREFEEEMQRIKDAHSQVDQQINAALSEVQLLYKYTEDSVKQSVERLLTRQNVCDQKIEQSIRSRKEQFAADRAALQKRLADRLSVVQAAMEQQVKTREKRNQEEREKVTSLRNELATLSQKQGEEFKAAQANARKEVEEYEASVKAKQAQRVKDLEIAFGKKQKEKQAKLEDQRKKLEAEIRSKAEPKTAPDSIPSTPDSKSEEFQIFESSRGKLTEKLQLVTSQIEGVVSDREKSLAKFNAELSSLDKLKRQMQRRIETEKRAIDDEYERKIQIAQVNLQKSIENISKLYDEDENRRGREVVEMIRKVRETRNRIDDFLKRKSKELDALQKENHHAEDAMKLEIKRLTERTQLNQLEQRLRDLQQSIEAEMNDIETSKRSRLEEIDALIATTLSDHETSKQTIASETQTRVDSLNALIEEQEKAIQAITITKEESLAKIRAKYNAMEEDIVRRSSAELDKMRKRIEAAQQKKREVEEELEGTYSKLKEQYDQAAERQAQEAWKRIQAGFAVSKQKADALEAKVNELWAAKAKLEDAFLDLPPKPEDQKRIGLLQTEIATQAAEISAKFEATAYLLENGPTEKQMRERRAAIAGKVSSAKIEKLAPLQAPT